MNLNKWLTYSIVVGTSTLGDRGVVTSLDILFNVKLSQYIKVMKFLVY